MIFFRSFVTKAKIAKTMIPNQMPKQKLLITREKNSKDIEFFSIEANLKYPSVFTSV